MVISISRSRPVASHFVLVVLVVLVDGASGASVVDSGEVTEGESK